MVGGGSLLQSLSIPLMGASIVESTLTGLVSPSPQLLSHITVDGTEIGDMWMDIITCTTPIRRIPSSFYPFMKT